MDDFNFENNIDEIMNRLERIFRENFLLIKIFKLSSKKTLFSKLCNYLKKIIHYLVFFLYTLMPAYPKVKYVDLISSINESLSLHFNKRELKLIIESEINMNKSNYNFKISFWGFITAITFWGYQLIVTNNSNIQAVYIIDYINVGFFIFLNLMLLYLITQSEYKIKKKCFYELVYGLLYE